MSEFVLPNVRKTFIPDPGYVMFDADLAGADAQVVAWEAEDEDLKAAFRAGLDVHAKNAEDMLGAKFTSLPLGSYARDKVRKKNKVAVHATNYGGSARGLAPRLNWTVHETDQFQKRWFSLHPGILAWHKRIQHALDTSRTVYNRYGFRRVFFDRPDVCFPEALAWIPQSTVALCTYYGAFQLEEKIPFVELLLQCHDSLVFQLPESKPWTYEAIKKGLSTVTPYDDPLTIPWGIAQSKKSWGDLEKIAA